MARQTISDHQIDLMCELYPVHLSTTIVGRILKIDPETVRKYLHIRKVPIRKRAGNLRGPGHPGWKGGRNLDRDGYVLIACLKDQPGARGTGIGKRQTGRILEHRVFAEIQLGRYLRPTEVVDHIDGCKIHNDPSNLRVFESNADHLRETISGQVPQWSTDGTEKLRLSRYRDSALEALNKFPEVIDTHRQNKRRGVLVTRQILRARELLDSRSIWFLGMRRHFEKIGIDWPFDQKTEQDLQREYLRRLLVHPDMQRWIEG